MTPAQVAFVTAVVVALLQIGYVAARVIYGVIVYDSRPAMIVHQATLRADVVAPGDPLQYHMVYTKRSDCHPPLGLGLLRYRVQRLDAPPDPHRAETAFWLPDEVPSAALPGDGMSLGGYATVALPVLPPGVYTLQWRGTYICSRSPQPEERYGPPLQFRVTG